MYKYLIHLYLIIHLKLVKRLYKKGTAVAKKSKKMILVGTFYSENWIMNHLRSFELCSNIEQVYIVCEFPIPKTKKITWIKPSYSLGSVLGTSCSKYISFVIGVIKYSPDIIGGFHILYNGLVAQLLAVILNKKSLYINGGGPRETLGGGYLSNIHNQKIGAYSQRLENILIETINYFDCVVTMGENTIKYYENRKVNVNFHVIPGSVVKEKLKKIKKTKIKYDIILVGRLLQVKRVDRFIQICKILVDDGKMIKAVVIGDGPLMDGLKAQIKELNLNKHIELLGYRKNVDTYLNRSKVFVLTSDSEGLSLAMMEAMLKKLPVVVSDVGELGSLVKNGYNGYCIPPEDIKQFSEFIKLLLNDKNLYKELADNAFKSILKLNRVNMASRWMKLVDTV